jgi:hypothetical protein
MTQFPVMMYVFVSFVDGGKEVPPAFPHVG